jgi:pyruvate,water dikinase
VIRAAERFDEATAALDRNDGGKLAEHLEDAHGLFARHWTVHWLIFESEKQFDPLHAAVEAATGEPTEAAKRLAAKLIEGEETVLTRLIDRLYELGRLAGADPALAELVRESHRAVAVQSADAASEAAMAASDPSPPDDLSARLAALPETAPFRRQLDALLAEFGHRVGAGFGSDVTCHMASWREDPRKALALAAPYLDAAVEPPARRRERARTERDAWLDRLCGACPDQAKADELRRQVAYGRRLATDLEEHNHYIDQLTFGQLRQALVLAAGWLVDRGLIARRDDVFWLRLDELLGALRVGSPAPLHDRVAERRAQHALWHAESPPPVVGAPEPKLDPRPPFKDELTAGAPPGATRLEGEAASPGRHRGRARVVATAVVLPPLEPGDVLVAENAGPQWTPLFPVLGAIVLDGGALTQHAATTAREYGVPCVIRTHNASHRIPDGATVVVDGSAGTVEIESASG